jgi:hypothetical protein
LTGILLLLLSFDRKKINASLSHDIADGCFDGSEHLAIGGIVQSLTVQLGEFTELLKQRDSSVERLFGKLGHGWHRSEMMRCQRRRR